MNVIVIAASLLAAAAICGQPSPNQFQIGAGGGTPPVPGIYNNLKCQTNGFCEDQGPGCEQRGWRAGVRMQPGDAWAAGDRGDCVNTQT